MRRTERELTDVEIIDAFDEILAIIICNYDRQVSEDFKKASRAAEIGYTIQKRLIELKIIEPGKNEDQRRMEV